MSVHCEYVEAKHAYVEYLPEADIDFAEDPGDKRVLLISYDEAIIFTGTEQELLKLADRIIYAVKHPI